jgi:hypothetical protein
LRPCGCKVYEGTHRENIDGSEMAFWYIHCDQSYKESKKRAKKLNNAQEQA